MNKFRVSKHVGIFGNAVATECSICESEVRYCKRRHIPNSLGFHDGPVNERQIGSVRANRDSVHQVLHLSLTRGEYRLGSSPIS